MIVYHLSSLIFSQDGSFIQFAARRGFSACLGGGKVLCASSGHRTRARKRNGRAAVRVCRRQKDRQGDDAQSREAFDARSGAPAPAADRTRLGFDPDRARRRSAERIRRGRCRDRECLAPRQAAVRCVTLAASPGICHLRYEIPRARCDSVISALALAASAVHLPVCAYLFTVWGGSDRPFWDRQGGMARARAHFALPSLQSWWIRSRSV